MCFNGFSDLVGGKQYCTAKSHHLPPVSISQTVQTVQSEKSTQEYSFIQKWLYLQGQGSFVLSVCVSMRPYSTLVSTNPARMWFPQNTKGTTGTNTWLDWEYYLTHPSLQTLEVKLVNRLSPEAAALIRWTSRVRGGRTIMTKNTHSFVFKNSNPNPSSAC